MPQPINPQNPLAPYVAMFPSQAADQSVMGCAQWLIASAASWSEKDFDKFSYDHLLQVVDPPSAKNSDLTSHLKNVADMLRSNKKGLFDDDDYLDDFFEPNEWDPNQAPASGYKKIKSNTPDPLQALKQYEEALKKTGFLNTKRNEEWGEKSASKKTDEVIKMCYNIAINQNLSSPLVMWCLRQNLSVALAPPWEILCNLVVQQKKDNRVLFAHIKKTKMWEQQQSFERLCKQALILSRPDWVSGAWLNTDTKPKNVAGVLLEINYQNPNHIDIAKRLILPHQDVGERVTPNPEPSRRLIESLLRVGVPDDLARSFFRQIFTTQASSSAAEKEFTIYAHQVLSAPLHMRSMYIEELFGALLMESQPAPKPFAKPLKSSSPSHEMNYAQHTGFRVFKTFLDESNADASSSDVAKIATMIVHVVGEEVLGMWVQKATQEAIESGLSEAEPWRILNMILDTAPGDNVKQKSLVELQRLIQSRSPALAALWTKNAIQAALPDQVGQEQSTKIGKSKKM